jgi:hypothetical protein
VRSRSTGRVPGSGSRRARRPWRAGGTTELASRRRRGIARRRSITRKQQHSTRCLLLRSGGLGLVFAFAPLPARRLRLLTPTLPLLASAYSRANARVTGAFHFFQCPLAWCGRASRLTRLRLLCVTALRSREPPMLCRPPPVLPLSMARCNTTPAGPPGPSPLSYSDLRHATPRHARWWSRQGL